LYLRSCCRLGKGQIAETLPCARGAEKEKKKLLMSRVIAQFSESNILLPITIFYGAKLLSKDMTMRFIRVAGLIEGDFRNGMENGS
jgi:hypothetical protein